MNKISFEIKTISGIHIGVAMTPYDKGGVDSYTIKDSEGFPYIPASSIKGKFRYFLDNISLFCDDEFLEEINQNFNFKLKKNEKNEEISNYLFKREDENTELNEFNVMKKIIFQDAILNEEFKNEKNLYEIKAENNIEIKGEEVISNPRIIERTVQGLKYQFNVIIIGFDDENFIGKLIERVFDYISEYGYIGGNGTRGYGRVKIEKTEKGE